MVSLLTFCQLNFAWSGVLIMSIMIRCCATESILMSVTSCVQSCTQLSGLVWRVGSVQSLLMITKKLLRTRYCTAAMCECTVYTISCNWVAALDQPAGAQCLTMSTEAGPDAAMHGHNACVKTTAMCMHDIPGTICMQRST